MPRTKREPAPSAPRPLGLDLAGAASAGEAYERIARAFDEGRLSAADARIAVDLLKIRSTVVAAEEFRRRLELAEAAAREAQRASLPARRQVIEVEEGRLESN
ncbi:MAG: hypothetical protein QM767_11555 [Anaeromyxobacter sp.]